MSYGTNAPQGLQPYCCTTGATWNQATSEYLIAPGYATAIFSGDPVAPADNGTIVLADPENGPFLGVFWGCEYIDAATKLTVNSKYWPASQQVMDGTQPVAYIIDEINLLFNVQVANNAGGVAPAQALILSDLNVNAGLNAGAGGNTMSGLSGMYLDKDSFDAPAATLPLKIMKLTPIVASPANAFGMNFNNALVLINNAILKGGDGTAGH